MYESLGPKLQGETVWEYFDFKLEHGDSILSAWVTCATYSGVDGAPRELVLGSSVITGSRVAQLITAGIPGVTYELQCQIFTARGGKIDSLAHYVVLPADMLEFIEVLVSHLYPSVVLENIDVMHSFLAGEMYTSVVTTFDNVDVTHAFTAGVLTSQLMTYSGPVESVDVTHGFASGSLISQLIAYSVPVESVDVTHAFASGVLTTVLITYSNWPTENVDVTHAFTSGTLT